jgi:hypothetical protein
MCSDAPDTSGMNAAAERNAAISEEALDFYRQMYEDSGPDRERAADTAEEVARAQLEAMRNQTALADEYANYQRTTLRPLEMDIVREANSFDTEAERERLAGLALGDVNESFAAAREQAGRQLTRSGVSLEDGAYGGVLKQLALSQSLAGADAKTKSRSNAITLGRALKADAAAMLRGLPSNQATSASLALNQGNSAVGNASVPITLAQSGADMMGRGYQTAIQGNNASGNMYGQIAGIESGVNSSNDSNMQGAGATIATVAIAI